MGVWGACPPIFSYFNESSSLDMFLQINLVAFKRKCNGSIRVIVLLEWLTALLEYFDLAL